jgi:XTP/dITP diphosphohydrolase
LVDIVVGTRNAHKILELQRILGPLVPDLVLHPATGEAPIEDGETFSANALIKARSAYLDTGMPAIADDSGIVVDALGGAPGIFSARYALSGLDADNTALLLANMAGKTDRTARFVCAAALVHSGGETVIEATWEGTLAGEPAGARGFGYDPIFIPRGESRSSAELGDDEKDHFSHRGQAFRALAAHLVELSQSR